MTQPVRRQSGTAYRNVAVVVKTRGIRGEVVVTSTTGLPFAVPEGTLVHLTPPPLRGIRKARVEYVDEGYPSSLVKFHGVDDIDTASTLVGRTVLVHRDDYPDDDGRLDLIGRSVHCIEKGPLGSIIEEFQAGSANFVWTVEGPFGEVLIPVVDEVVLDIPEDPSQPISVRLPYGLIADEPERGFGDEVPVEDDSV